MSPRRNRIIGGAIILAGAAMLAFALPAMTARLRERSETAPPVRWFVETVYDDEFRYHGHPVELRTVSDGPEAFVEVHWMGAVERLPVTGRDDPRLPELMRHADWLRVLQMVKVRGGQTPDEALATPEGEHRVVVASRAPDEGLSENKRGKMRRNAWKYTFVRLLPEGGVDRSSAFLPQLEQRTWQHAAALEVTNTPRRPAAELVDDGFGALGWTWPVGGIGVLLLFVGAMVVGGSFLPPRAQEPPSGPAA